MQGVYGGFIPIIIYSINADNPAPPTSNHILTEDGDFLLTEINEKIDIE